MVLLPRHSSLATNNSQLAEAVLAILPVSITNVCVLQLQEKAIIPDELNELDNYRHLLFRDNTNNT